MHSVKCDGGMLKKIGIGSNSPLYPSRKQSLTQTVLSNGSQWNNLLGNFPSRVLVINPNETKLLENPRAMENKKGALY